MPFPRPVVLAVWVTLRRGDHRHVPLVGHEPGRSGSESTGTSVTVERETDATTERAVKQSDAAETSVEDEPESETDEESDRGTEDDPETDEESVSGDGEPDAADEESGSDDGESEGAEDGVPVEEIKGIGPAYGERLADAGVHTVSDLAAADAADLAAATGIEEGRIGGWIERAAEN